MKFLRSFALLLMSVFCVSQGFCHERQDNSSSEKIYLHPGQISLLSDGIFIWLNNQQVSVDAIYADSNGLYTSPIKFGWTCPKCKYENKWYANQCEKCGYR
jgi:hypothetical protein